MLSSEVLSLSLDALKNCVMMACSAPPEHATPRNRIPGINARKANAGTRHLGRFMGATSWRQPGGATLRFGERAGASANRLPRLPCGRVGWGVVRLFVLFFNEARDRHDFVVGCDVDQRYALSRAPYRAHIVGRHPENHALLRNQEELVALLHVRHSHHQPVL